MNKKTAPQAAQKKGKGNEVVEEEPLPENGNDKFNCSAGAKYEGEWKRFDGVIKRHGTGKFTTEEFVYEGEFSEDLFHGKGLLKYNTGSYYEGEFQNGKITGEGEVLFQDGSKYRGHWQDGRMHGIGTFITIDNQEWTGRWCHGMSNCPIFPQLVAEAFEEEEEEETQDIQELQEGQENMQED